MTEGQAGVAGAAPARDVKKVLWDDYTEAIPAFITMLMMPLSYSISDGIMLGLIMYVLNLQDSL